MNPARIAVFASGRGSNFDALASYLDSVKRSQLALVMTTDPRAGVVARAIARNIPVKVLEHPDDGDWIVQALKGFDIGTVALAGYLKMIPEVVVKAYHGRMLNVHPSLLPAFGGKGMYGRRVHEAVLAAGAKVSGATVHFVSAEYDRGPILAQWPVPVSADDTPETLAHRVLATEHALFSRCVHLLATERIALGPNDQIFGLQPIPHTAMYSYHAGHEIPHDVDAHLF